jgi:hypothetical protein
MRKIFLPLVMMVCTLGVGLASGQTGGQPQPDQSKQDQTTQNETKSSSRREDCSSKDTKRSQNDTEGDPEAPQNKVEYGGGG